MKYSLLICIVLLNIITRTNTMEEKKSKTIYNIKIPGLSQASEILPTPIVTPHKRPSPTTEDALKRDALPRRFSDPIIEKRTSLKSATSSDEKK